MKHSEQGQVAIPKESHGPLRVSACTAFEFGNDTIVVRKVRNSPTLGRQLAERPRGRGDVAMTTDEIMTLTRSR